MSPFTLERKKGAFDTKESANNRKAVPGLVGPLFKERRNHALGLLAHILEQEDRKNGKRPFPGPEGDHALSLPSGQG